MILRLVFQITFLSWTILAQSPPFTKPNCLSRCGNVTIPFPFGMGSDCYLDGSFAINCNSSTPFLTSINNLQVVDISTETNTIRVNHPVYHVCPGENITTAPTTVKLKRTPFVYSLTSNRYTGVGCNNLAVLGSSNNTVMGGCLSLCDETTPTRVNSCNGVKCCQTTIPSSLDFFNASILGIDDNKIRDPCNYAFLVEQRWFQNELKNPQDVEKMSHVPVVLDWGIPRHLFDRFAVDNKSQMTANDLRSYKCGVPDDDPRFNATDFPIVQCQCFSYTTYQGNPYLLQGCQDINECEVFPDICSELGNSTICDNSFGGYSCFISNLGPYKEKVNFSTTIATVIGSVLGSLLLLAGIWWLFTVMKKRKDKKLRENFFKRNGGLLLQQQLTSFHGSVDRSKMFSSKELDKATDRFNPNRILGQGGQGTVYKGMLPDGRIVAVKKSKVVDKSQLEEFINEVAILSQINHRNVVKLLGCCLETEVPLLVYEFIPNGTLSQYLHVKDEELPVTWDMRLRIAVEVAGAISYLHSAASIPIYHRDIKSANILLDDKYRAKVADFGTSKSMDMDQTHVTTRVQGTFGYLDPEFFRSSQFTDKSDVYSFGVVLVELLTGQKAISSTRSSEEGRGLASYFILAMEQNRLCDIIDAQVIKMGKKEDIMATAKLANRCLYMNGKKRPTMKEVALELEGIRALQKDWNIGKNSHEKAEELEYTRSEVFEGWDVGSTSTFSNFDSMSLSVDIQKRPSITI